VGRQVRRVDHYPLRLWPFSGQSGEHPVKHAKSAPAHEAIVECLVRAIGLGGIFPLQAIFGDALRAGGTAELQLIVDGTDSNIAGVVLDYSAKMSKELSQKVLITRFTCVRGSSCVGDDAVVGPGQARRPGTRWRKASASATSVRRIDSAPARSAMLRATRSVRAKPRADRRRRSAACSARARASGATARTCGSASALQPGPSGP
jgi:hypothetical protein